MIGFIASFFGKLSFKSIMTIVMMICLVLSLVCISQLKKTSNYYRDAFYSSEESITYYKLKDSSSVAQISSLFLTIDDIERAKDSTINAMIEENKELGIKLRRTTQLLAIEMNTKDTVSTIIRDTNFVFGNSTITKMATFDDGFLTADIMIDTKDSLHMAYNVNNQLHITGYWERDSERSWFARTFWLAPKRYFINVVNKNPNSTVEYAKEITVSKHKNKR